MELDRLQNLLFLVGASALATGCPDDTPGDDGESSTGGDTTNTTPVTMSASGSSASASTSTGTTGPDTDPSTSTSTSTSTGPGSSTTEAPPDTSSTTTEATSTTTTGSTTDSTESTTNAEASTTFPDFTSGGYYFEVCDDLAAQLAYCFDLGPEEEQYQQYLCNNVQLSGFYGYSYLCGLYASLYFTCLSSMDCAEFDGDQSDGPCATQLASAEANCGI